MGPRSEARMGEQRDERYVFPPVVGFRLRTHSTDHAVEVTAHGVLDADTGVLLVDAIRACSTWNGVRSVVVDIRDVTEIEPSALPALVEARRCVTAAHCTVVIRWPLFAAEDALELQRL